MDTEIQTGSCLATVWQYVSSAKDRLKDCFFQGQMIGTETKAARHQREEGLLPLLAQRMSILMAEIDIPKLRSGGDFELASLSACWETRTLTSWRAL